MIKCSGTVGTKDIAHLWMILPRQESYSLANKLSLYNMLSPTNWP